jgi:hypothetical protein
MIAICGAPRITDSGVPTCGVQPNGLGRGEPDVDAVAIGTTVSGTDEGDDEVDDEASLDTAAMVRLGVSFAAQDAREATRTIPSAWCITQT